MQFLKKWWQGRSTRYFQSVAFPKRNKNKRDKNKCYFFVRKTIREVKRDGKAIWGYTSDNEGNRVKVYFDKTQGYWKTSGGVYIEMKSS